MSALSIRTEPDNFVRLLKNRLVRQNVRRDQSLQK
jgi:hypothetical protein